MSDQKPTQLKLVRMALKHGLFIYLLVEHGAVYRNRYLPMGNQTRLA
ncbi:hypothetical protein [Amphibacillus sediminis]|nr:hypothetical protein [Amphibacillus sediminis]